MGSIALDEVEEQTEDDLFRTAVVFESMLGLAALLLGWLIGPDPRNAVPDIDWSQEAWTTWKPILQGLGYGLVATPPMLAFVAIVRRLPLEAVRELERLGEEGLVGMLLKLRPTELIVISLCAGVGEELLFRGWLMPWLIAGGSGTGEDASTLGIGIGLVGSSIAFGLVHSITKLYVLITAVIGLYLGVLLLMTGNLLVPIVAHATYDAVQLFIASREKRSAEASA